MNIKTIIKKVIAIVICAAVILSSTSAFATVLGSTIVDSYTMQIGEGLEFTHNIFYSDQSSVGKQSENYITYTPNSTVIPTITYGTALYGGNTLSDQVSTMENQGIDILAGTNADYFSSQTLVPMSTAIVNGKILTKDASGQDAVGILEDGTAFISYVYFNSVLTREDGSEVNIYNINKYRQPYAAYMMTREFSDTTRNTTKGFDVILGSVEGEMKIGETITAIVESVTENSSSITIPEGKIVITVDSKAPEEFLKPISSLVVGEKVRINFSATGDNRWSKVKTGMGSVGGRLLINGKVNSNLPTGAAPRTAIGVKEDGSIILYTLDGRKTGHSYGAQLKTLAKRMQELECVDALNLDGGGSTAISVQFPGNASASVINKPSDGKERKISTHFIFTNTAEKSGETTLLHLYPQTSYILNGATIQLDLKATDSGFYPSSVPDDVVYSIQEGKNSTISQDGLFKANDNGAVTVYAKNDLLTASTTITCFKTPTSIKIKDSSTGKEITNVTLDPGETVSLSANAYAGYNQLISANECFTWECDSNIGIIDSSGVFTATDEFGKKGNIRIKAGDTTVEIPVALAPADANDTNAYPVIDMSFESGTLTGTITCEYNIATLKDEITLKADGKEAEIYYNKESGEFTAELPGNTQKITLYATNEFGFTTFKTITVKETPLENPFADTEGHWAENILSYLYNQKIINGDPTSGSLKFFPQKQMTRSEFAVMIVNYLGVDPTDYSDVILPYSDIDNIPFWAVDSFKALYDLGIVKGRYVSDTESCADPLSSISRGEAATIVARTLPQGFFTTEITAPDKSDVASWAETGISALLNIGAMKGYEDGTLKPLNPLTKAEAAKILYSAM